MQKQNYKKIPQYLLIKMAQQNDQKALEELVKRIQKEIFGIFLHLCKKREIVADLTQEALVKIAKNITKLKDINKFKTWANKIAVNIFYDEIRKNSRHLENIDTLEDSVSEEIKDDDSLPFEKCLANELDCIIKNSILSLPIDSRIAIILREFEGLSYQDIATLTKTSIGNVKSRISRARVKLQKLLYEYL